jgi:hypothetical protein
MARLMEKVFLFTTVPPEKSFGKGQQLSPTLQTIWVCPRKKWRGKEEHQNWKLSSTDPESFLNLVKQHTPALNQSQRMF